MEMLANYVLVEPETWGEQKVGLIAIPTDATNAFARGEVLRVGPGVYLPNGKLLEVDVKPCDHVLYFKKGAAGIVVNGKEMHIIQEREILAILDSEDFTDKGESNASD